MSNFILCSVQRSGKTWIADTLRRLGLGHGLELLTEFERGCAPGQERLAAAMRDGGMRGLLRCFADDTARDGFAGVGISLQWSNFHSVIPETIAMLSDIGAALTPANIYFIRRRDELGQAISHLLMVESGYAHSSDPDDLRGRRAAVAYDRGLLEGSLRHVRGCYAGWHALFDAAGISPTTLYYEDFVDDPRAAFGDLAAEIAGSRFAPDAIAAAAAGLRRISDGTDDTFRALYLAGR